MNQRGLAEAIGEWAFYIAVLMMVLALVKRFPYRRFFQTHRVLAATYLALVAHAVVLFKFEHWNSLLGVTLAALMTAGSIAAVMSLFRKHAGGTQVAGRVVAIERHPEADVMAVEIQLDDGWRGHQSGQFAFVTFHADEGPHPFTIASCWNDDGRIRFVIKALGDYTRSLSKRLQVDDTVKVEGPYGRFNFESDAPHQIWIGGGIGITPFIARMGDLARTKGGEAVDLFHTTAAYDRTAIDKLERDAAAGQGSAARAVGRARWAARRRATRQGGAGLAQRRRLVLRTGGVRPDAPRRADLARVSRRTISSGALRVALGKLGVAAVAARPQRGVRGVRFQSRYTSRSKPSG